MRKESLQPGWYVHWQGEVYCIRAIDTASATIQAEHSDSRCLVSLRLDDLLCQDPPAQFAPSVEALQNQSTVQAIGPTLADDLADMRLQRADEIMALVETVERLVNEEYQRSLRYGEPFRRTTAVRRALARLETPVALATFYKYRRLTQQASSRAQLASALRRSTFNQTKLSRAQLHFIDCLLVRYYGRSRPLRPMTIYRLAQSVLVHTRQFWLDPDRCPGTIPVSLVEELLDYRLSIQTILDNPEKACLLTPIQMPSRGWFYQYLRWFEAQSDQGQAVITARYGKAAWEQQHLVFDSFVKHATFPLQYVFADHWLLDVFIVDEATRRTPQRLWLTILIDAYSRCVLGMALLYESPCIDSIQQALFHAIYPKTVAPLSASQQEWACFGIPQQLFLDNAWAHHSHSLEDLARHISQQGQYNSIDLVFRPPYKGRYGAIIERFFGNLSAQVKEQLPGALRSEAPQHLRQAAQQACLLYGDLKDFLYQRIVAYLHQPHQELAGMTPHQKWLEGMQAGLPLVPAPTPAVRRLFWRMAVDTRVITSKGISAFGMHYWSPEVGGLARVGRNGQPVRYRFRYDPLDISHLALFHEGQWLGDIFAKELRQSDGTYQAVSLAEREIAQDMARAQSNSPQDWLRYVQDIDDLTRTRQVEKRRAYRHARSDTAQVPLHAHTVEAALPDSPVDNDYTDLLTRFMSHEE